LEGPGGGTICELLPPNATLGKWRGSPRCVGGPTGALALAIRRKIDYIGARYIRGAARMAPPHGVHGGSSATRAGGHGGTGTEGRSEFE